jgi:hypothetical protein
MISPYLIECMAAETVKELKDDKEGNTGYYGGDVTNAAEYVFYRRMRNREVGVTEDRVAIARISEKAVMPVVV